MHQKISKMPKTWPIPRKGKGRYVAVASHSKTKGITLLAVLRNVLKIAKTRKEVRFFLLNGEVKVNNKVRKDETFPLQFFDVIQLEKTKKNYRLNIVNKKFRLEEIPETDSDKKIVKVSGKKILRGGGIQMNLEDGQNLIVKDRFNVGDSVVINTKENKIERILPLVDGAKVEIISGKHAGKKGTLKFIENLQRKKVYHIKLKDKEVELPSKTILVTG